MGSAGLHGGAEQQQQQLGALPNRMLHAATTKQNGKGDRWGLWDTLRLVPAVPLQPGWDLRGKKLPEPSEGSWDLLCQSLECFEVR